MKRLFIALLLVLAMAGLASAGTKTITFLWQQDAADLPTLTGWKIYKADTAGGPYTLLYTINYNGTPSQEYTSGPQALVSPDGQIKTYYFVATAFKPGSESAKSNEVSAVIDFKTLSVPIQFKLTVTTP
jgi:hypothetical protein